MCTCEIPFARDGWMHHPFPPLFLLLISGVEVVICGGRDEISSGDTDELAVFDAVSSGV
jgi:hypothetical protein